MKRRGDVGKLIKEKRGVSSGTSADSEEFIGAGPFIASANSLHPNSSLGTSRCR